jgi:chromosome partitioning protein
MERELSLVGLAEIAEMLGASKQTIANWRSRYSDFPAPVADLRSGPVWAREEVSAWAQRHEIVVAPQRLKAAAPEPEGDRNVAITVAVVNMKGGVGKSTVTAQLGWYCAQRKGKRVLLVDLDPQFNLSVYVLRPDRYEKLITDQHKTVLHIFERMTPEAITGKPMQKIEPADVVVNVISSYNGRRKLDIIPSQLQLAWTLKTPTPGKERMLNDFLDDVRSDYDLILIDCPPTESMLTMAAYLASDQILVPVRPEFLSTIGLPLLVRSLDEFRGLYRGRKIELMGVLFNASGAKDEHYLSRESVKETAAANGWYVFKNEVTFSDSYAKGSRKGSPIFATAYARSWKVQDMVDVAEEFVRRAGL